MEVGGVKGTGYLQAIITVVLNHTITIACDGNSVATGPQEGRYAMAVLLHS